MMMRVAMERAIILLFRFVSAIAVDWNRSDSASGWIWSGCGL